jgi:asparagine synthase (glutamine-hydrolysing)
MCGIVAFLGRERPVSEDALARAAASLRHRGPDTQRSWCGNDGTVGLAHTRLSIIDLTTGDQPIANEDGSCRIVVNGEFYDFERLQRELMARGHRLATRSDSEVALHLYEERGMDCLRELRGEFAFAVWDGRERRLLAARDRFGIKPLYYTTFDGVLMLASEMKAFAAAGVPLRWDEAALGESLLAHGAAEGTIFKNIFQVPPGHYLAATSESFRVERYWDLDYPGEEEAAGSRTEAEWIEGARERIVEAVRLRLRADVPVGCLLSGGLDSSSALGIAWNYAGSGLKAFTIAFDDPALDESHRAADTAAFAGADFHPIRVTDQDLAEVFSDAVWHTEGFHYNGHGSARYILAREVRAAGIKVVLAGEGADELSAGYQFCRKSLGLAGALPAARWPKELLELFGAEAPTAEKITALLPLLRERAHALGFPESTFGNLTGKIALQNDLLAPAFAERWCRPEAIVSHFRSYDIAGQVDGREPIKQVLYLWIKSGLANYLLGGERLDMAYAVEQRLPFLDHRLFEWMRSAPASLLWRDGREKWILREALKPFVTDAVYRGIKHPFTAPKSTLRAGSAMLALAQDLLRSQVAAEVPFLNHRGLVRLMDRLRTPDPKESPLLDATVLLLMSIVVLHDRYRLGS